MNAANLSDHLESLLFFSRNSIDIPIVLTPLRIELFLTLEDLSHVSYVSRDVASGDPKPTIPSCIPPTPIPPPTANHAKETVRGPR